ncbi:hypothetical protein [Pedobacter soli]|uniref:Uncharacterized protein n=1 Tax=Pedobacter soli TaxID=390242 RepID=A0A1G6MQ59_9SPHI|nr:hypothetical protein [Pedobacter soli]SDC57670.1 hypothetical protein SAMN04488024_102420 [Pedobacter soli]
MVPNINIQQDQSNPFYDLVKTIYRYYAIGVGEPNTFYKGYQDLTNIITEKINRLIAGDMPVVCAELSGEVKQAFPNYTVRTSYHKQFPNYAIEIELPKKEYPEIHLIYHLKLRISLLTKYYTLFFEEMTLHQNIKSGLSGQQPLRSIAVSSALTNLPESEQMVTALKEIIKKIFPDYHFVSHRLLMSRKIKGGYPHGADHNPYKDEFSIYNFLFDNEYEVFPGISIC